MDKPTADLFGEPRVEGADYVALVIEWDETAAAIEREIAAADETTQRRALPVLVRSPDRARPSTLALAAGVLGALAVIALAGWGIHRLRAA